MTSAFDSIGVQKVPKISLYAHDAIPLVGQYPTNFVAFILYKPPLNPPLSVQNPILQFRLKSHVKLI